MNRRFVLTGAPGAGKTPIIAELVALGFRGVLEPARAAIAKQRSIDERPIYDRDPKLFNELMLEHATTEFCRADGVDTPVVFDRGIPDLVAYADLSGLDRSAAWSAAETYRYAELVFVTPSWREIYTTDEDRRMTFEQADVFGRMIRDVYDALGYTIVDVPHDTPAERARFIAAKVDATRLR